MDIYKSVPVGHINFVDPVFERECFFDNAPAIRVFGGFDAFGSATVPVREQELYIFAFSNIFHHNQMFTFGQIYAGNVFVIAVAIANTELFAQHCRTQKGFVLRYTVLCLVSSGFKRSG